jgi:hypothetical protein
VLIGTGKLRRDPCTANSTWVAKRKIHLQGPRRRWNSRSGGATPCEEKTPTEWEFTSGADSGPRKRENSFEPREMPDKLMPMPRRRSEEPLASESSPTKPAAT